MFTPRPLRSFRIMHIKGHSNCALHFSDLLECDKNILFTVGLYFEINDKDIVLSD